MSNFPLLDACNITLEEVLSTIDVSMHTLFDCRIIAMNEENNIIAIFGEKNSEAAVKAFHSFLTDIQIEATILDNELKYELEAEKHSNAEIDYQR